MVLTFAVLSRSMGGYMRGTLITSLANGLMVAAGLALIGHPYAGLIGIATFVLHFVPVIGPFLSSISAVLLGLFVSPVCAFWTLVITVVAQNVTDNVLSPLVMRVLPSRFIPALSLLGHHHRRCGSAVPWACSWPCPSRLPSRASSSTTSSPHTGRQLVSREGALFGSTPFNYADGRPQPTFDALDDDTFIARSRLLDGLTRLHEQKKAAAPTADGQYGAGCGRPCGGERSRG